LNVDILHNHFYFTRHGVAYWEDQKALLIADVHLGKISHFRKYGSAVPQNAIQKNFDRLDEAVKEFQPQKIIFLGDLFHSAFNMEWNLFESWVKSQSAKIILITGNHDIISPLCFEEIGVEVIPELHIGIFRLTHHPEEREGTFNICGHIHPGYRLSGMGKQHLKLKCFFQSQNQLILPAFGEFTGVYVMKPNENEKVYVCTSSKVIQVA